MKLFTTGDIRELTGIAANTFDRWCVTGLVTPVSGGTGTGDHRQWSLTQAVGFVVAEEIRKSEQGCVPAYVGKIVEAFGSVDEEWLRKRIERDGPYFIMPHQGRPLFQGDGKQWGWPDVRAALKQVTAYATKKRE